MDCAGFEAGLARLLAEPGAANDAALRDKLKAHAEGCDGCRPSLPLIEIALLPTEERDPREAPAGYWEDFDTRLRQRLLRRRWSPRVTGWAAAAIVVLAIGVGWVITDRHPPTDDGDELGRIVELIEREGEEPLLGFDDPTEGWWTATEGLDGEAREELIRWLDEEAGQGEGGSV